jgi:hypothetical protein
MDRSAAPPVAAANQEANMSIALAVAATLVIVSTMLVFTDGDPG